MRPAHSGSVGGTDSGAAALALRPGVHLPGRGRKDDDDPLAAVLALGNRAAQIGAIIGMSIALLLHGAASVRAMTSLFEMRKVAEQMHAAMREFFWTYYDIDLSPKKPELKPPEKEPEPEPEPVIPKPAVKAPAPKNDDPYEPPPQAAQAAKVLTAPTDPDEPVDLTGEGFVSGDGTGLGYGMVSAQGRSTTPTYSPHASNTGVPGGRGSVAAPPPPPPGPDRSRPSGIIGATSWNDCAFPAEADAEQIDDARVVIIVTVRPDGTPQAVKVVTNPGYGFGRQARICALARKYTPGLDRDGKPIAKDTPPITVRFTR